MVADPFAGVRSWRAAWSPGDGLRALKRGATLLSMSDSQLPRARTLLLPPQARAVSLAAVTTAAAFFAISALALATTVVMMPTPWPT